MPGFPTAVGRGGRRARRLPEDGQEPRRRARPTPATALKYRFTGYKKFLDPDGYPAIAPPWGTLTAINLDTGEHAWQVPLGEYPELAAQGLTDTGSENYGGPVVTAGGLVFIGATSFDRKFRAFDKATGALLWEATLPFSATGTPATYEVAGRQFVVVARRRRQGRRSDAAGCTSPSRCRAERSDVRDAVDLDQRVSRESRRRPRSSCARPAPGRSGRGTPRSWPCSP